MYELQTSTQLYTHITEFVLLCMQITSMSSGEVAPLVFEKYYGEKIATYMRVYTALKTHILSDADPGEIASPCWEMKSFNITGMLGTASAGAQG